MSGSNTFTSSAAANALVSQIATLVEAQVMASLQPKLAAMQTSIEQAVEAAEQAAAQTAAQLPQAGEIADGDGSPVVQDGKDVLATQEQLAAYYAERMLSLLGAGVQAVIEAAGAPSAPALAASTTTGS